MVGPLALSAQRVLIHSGILGLRISKWTAHMNVLHQSLIFCALALALAAAAHAAPVEEWVLDLNNNSAQRPVKVHITYPSGDCEAVTEAQRCLTPQARRDRVVLLSHGSMGSATDYQWLTQALAAGGYVVVGVSHFGESWIYGQDTINPASVLSFWQRPQDLSFVLDTLSKQELFPLPLNWNNVVVVGHSAGGQTAAALAGVRYDIGAMVDYCSGDHAVGDRSCAYGSSAPLTAEPFVEAYAGDYSDKRIAAIVLLDPAMGPAATSDSLINVKAKALIVGAHNNNFLPYANHAGRYAQLIGNAEVIKLDGAEGHFIFLDPCDHDYEAMGVSLCKDREGVDRVEVQRKLSKAVVDFVGDLE